MRRWLAFGLFWAWGCAAEPAPDDLRSVTIPPDFTFATSRPVKVAISGSAATLGAAQAGLLTLQLPDGGILYRGPLLAGKPVEVDLVVPTKDSSLWLELQVEGQALIQQQLNLNTDAVAVTL